MAGKPRERPVVALGSIKKTAPAPVDVTQETAPPLITVINNNTRVPSFTPETGGPESEPVENWCESLAVDPPVFHYCNPCEYFVDAPHSRYIESSAKYQCRHPGSPQTGVIYGTKECVKININGQCKLFKRVEGNPS